MITHKTATWMLMVGCCKKMGACAETISLEIHRALAFTANATDNSYRYLNISHGKENRFVFVIFQSLRWGRIYDWLFDERQQWIVLWNEHPTRLFSNWLTFELKWAQGMSSRRILSIDEEWNIQQRADSGIIYLFALNEIQNTIIGRIGKWQWCCVVNWLILCTA